jgi:hypothetical protein
MAYANSVVAVASTNIPKNPPAITSLDGYPLTNPSRILLTKQNTPSENGIWIWTLSTAALTRPLAPDQYKAGNVLDNATLIPVTNGNTYAGTVWGVARAGVITVDTTSHRLTKVALPPVQARAATTVSILLTNTWTTIDNVSLVGNGLVGSDIVLVKHQTTPSQNGLYWANTTGTMARTSEPLVPSREILVSEGAANAHTRFVLVTQAAITPGTTSLTFSPQNLAVNVKDFGTKGDFKTVTDGVMTTGANFKILTCSPSAPFMAGDVGKSIIVAGAAIAGANLVATITGYMSASKVKLAAGCSTAVSGTTVQFGTDDTMAIQSAHAAALAGGGDVFYLPATTAYSLTTNAATFGTSRASTHRFARAAKVHVFGEIGVTFLGQIDAPPDQAIFEVGTGGSVLLPDIPVVHPGWFGAAYDGCKDDGPAHRAAIAAITTGVLQLGHGTTLINTAGSIGGGVACGIPIVSSGIHVRGHGRGTTVVKMGTLCTFIPVMAQFFIVGTDVEPRQLTDIDVTDFTISYSGTGGASLGTVQINRVKRFRVAVDIRGDGGGMSNSTTDGIALAWGSEDGFIDDCVVDGLSKCSGLYIALAKNIKGRIIARNGKNCTGLAGASGCQVSGASDCEIEIDSYGHSGYGVVAIVEGNFSATISALTDQTHFTIDFGATNPGPTVATYLAVKNTTTRCLEALNVFSVASAGGNTYAIVLSAAPAQTLAAAMSLVAGYFAPSNVTFRGSIHNNTLQGFLSGSATLPVAGGVSKDIKLIGMTIHDNGSYGVGGFNIDGLDIVGCTIERNSAALFAADAAANVDYQNLCRNVRISGGTRIVDNVIVGVELVSTVNSYVAPDTLFATSNVATLQPVAIQVVSATVVFTSKKNSNLRIGRFQHPGYSNNIMIYHPAGAVDGPTDGFYEFDSSLGSPEGQFYAPIGSLYSDTTGGASYIKSTGGTSNTGWKRVYRSDDVPYVNFVLAYGADPTGGVDCRQLFVNAINDQKTGVFAGALYVPAGTYKIDAGGNGGVGVVVNAAANDRAIRIVGDGPGLTTINCTGLTGTNSALALRGSSYTLSIGAEIRDFTVNVPNDGTSAITCYGVELGDAQRCIVKGVDVYAPNPLHLKISSSASYTQRNNAFMSCKFYPSRATTTAWTGLAGVTAIAALSNGVSLPQATINVVSNTTFAASGTLTVQTAAGYCTVAYAAKSGTTQFTGCAGGTGAMSTGGAVVTAQDVFAVSTPESNALIDNVRFADCEFAGAVSLRATLAHFDSCQFFNQRKDVSGYGSNLFVPLGSAVATSCYFGDGGVSVLVDPTLGVDVANVALLGCEFTGEDNAGTGKPAYGVLGANPGANNIRRIDVTGSKFWDANFTTASVGAASNVDRVDGVAQTVNVTSAHGTPITTSGVTNPVLASDDIAVKRLRQTLVTLTDGADPISIDLSLGTVFALALTTHGSHTRALTFTGLKSFVSFRLYLAQDGTGGEAVTFTAPGGGSISWNGGAALVPQTTAGRTQFVQFDTDGTSLFETARSVVF